MSQYLRRQPELAPWLAGADHLDVKQAPTRADLTALMAAAASWRPGWLHALYGLRGLLARLLRLRHDAMAAPPNHPPDLNPGAPFLFGQVVAHQPGRWLVVEGTDRHLTGRLIAVKEPGGEQGGTLHMATVVIYHSWTGPLYFNLIRPFHHLVVAALTRHAARRAGAPV